MFRDLPSKGGLIFFNPENGLEVLSCRKGKKDSSKYVYWDEVSKSYGSGHSVLIHQLDREAKRLGVPGSPSSRYGCRNGSKKWTDPDFEQ
jgi:hypothetical protein